MNTFLQPEQRWMWPGTFTYPRACLISSFTHTSSFYGLYGIARHVWANKKCHNLYFGKQMLAINHCCTFCIPNFKNQNKYKNGILWQKSILLIYFIRVYETQIWGSYLTMTCKITLRKYDNMQATTKSCAKKE